MEFVDLEAVEGEEEVNVGRPPKRKAVARTSSTRSRNPRAGAQEAEYSRRILTSESEEEEEQIPPKGKGRAQ